MKANNISALKLLSNPENYPGLIERNKSSRVFLLWRNNALSDYVSWSVFTDKEKYFVRRVVWRRASEYELEDPVTYGSEANAGKELMSKILADFDRLELHSSDGSDFKQGMQIDGRANGICIKGKEVQWITPTNKAMSKFHDWHERLIVEFNKLLPEHKG